MCLHAKLLQSCPTLCDPMDRSLPGSSVHGILQARKLERVAIPFSRGSFRPRDRTCVSYVSVFCIGRRVPYHKRHTGSPESAIHIYICVYTIYMYRGIPSFLGFPPLSPSPRTPPLQVLTEPRAEPPVLTAASHWLWFTRGHVCMSMLLSQFVPPSSGEGVSASLLSTSASLLNILKINFVSWSHVLFTGKLQS